MSSGFRFPARLKIRTGSSGLVLSGSSEESAVTWNADGQVAVTAVVTLHGSRPCSLDLNGHKTEFARLGLSKAGVVKTGMDGELRVKQLFVDGKRLPDGAYR